MELQEEAGSRVLLEQGRIGVFNVKCLLTTTLLTTTPPLSIIKDSALCIECMICGYL